MNGPLDGEAYGSLPFCSTRDRGRWNNDEAQQAKRALAAAAQGHDPAEEKQAARGAETFGELANEYLERHAKQKKRSWREDERILNRELRP